MFLIPALSCHRSTNRKYSQLWTRRSASNLWTCAYYHNPHPITLPLFAPLPAPLTNPPHSSFTLGVANIEPPSGCVVAHTYSAHNTANRQPCLFSPSLTFMPSSNGNPGDHAGPTQPVPKNLNIPHIHVHTYCSLMMPVLKPLYMKYNPIILTHYVHPVTLIL